METKKSLTPQEVIMVTHGHVVCGIDQHHLAATFGINPARIAEAIVIMRYTAEHHKKLYDELKKRQKLENGPHG